MVSIKVPNDRSNSRLVGSTIGNQRLGSERSISRCSPVRTRVQGWALWPLGEREAKSTSCRSAESEVMLPPLCPLRVRWVAKRKSHAWHSGVEQDLVHEDQRSEAQRCSLHG